MTKDIIVRDAGMLAQVERARAALSEIATVEDAIHVAKFADAVRYAAKQAKAGMDAENAAAEVRLRAERRAGEMLAKTEKQAGARGVGKRVESHDATPLPPTLSEIGVSKSQSSRYQQVAAVNEGTFEGYIESKKKSGSEITTSRLLRLGRESDAAAASAEEAPAEVAVGEIEIFHGDFREVLASADLTCEGTVVITDPPYPREYLPEWRDFAEMTLAADALIAMCGQTILPDALDAILSARKVYVEKDAREAELDRWHYRWCGAYLTPGPATRVWNAKVGTSWKPILIFDKGPNWGDREFVTSDLFRSTGDDKKHHHWGQSESGIAALVEAFTKPGDLVVDPFLGGGTTAIVCRDLGRRFLGCDIDAAAINRTKERLNA